MLGMGMDELAGMDEGSLPPEIQEQMDALRIEKETAQAQQLSALSVVMSKMRDEAITGRAAIGIETCWQDDQDAYEGIDDANRDSSTINRKPNSSGQYEVRPKNQYRSTVLPNMTGQFTDSAHARIVDMTMPMNERGYELDPTPIANMGPEQTKLIAQNMFQRAQKQHQEAMAQAQQAPQGGQPPQQMPPPQPPNKEQVEAHVQQIAKERAEKAQKRIDDWLEEALWHAEMRLVMGECVMLGTGVIKGPIPIKRRCQRAGMGEDGQITLTAIDEIVPASKWVSVWNVFPDPNAGENIHDGRYVWERAFLTEKGVRDLKGMDYLDAELDQVLTEGPMNTNDGAASSRNALTGNFLSDDGRYTVWYGYCWLTAEEMETAGCGCEGYEGSKESVPAQVTMINNRLVKVKLAVMDDGEFPYDLVVWRRRAGIPWGIGVAGQMAVAQRIITAATRNLMDNAGFSTRPITVIDRSIIEPTDNSWTLAPGKTYLGKSLDGMNQSDMSKAFTFIVPPNLQNDLLALIAWATDLAERITGLPMLMQGQQGAAPDTVGGMTMLQNNAGAIMRMFARRFDTSITLPHIRRYYKYLMMYGEDESEKGDYNVIAKGSSTLVERDQAAVGMIQMSPMTQDPAFGVDKYKWFAELCRGQRIDPEKVQMPEDEYKAMMEQMQSQPKPDPNKLAEIEGKQKIEEMKLQGNMQLGEAKLASEIKARETDAMYDERVEQIKAGAKSAEIQGDIAIANQDAEVKMAQILSQEGQNAATLNSQVGQTKLKIDAENARFNAETALVLTNRDQGISQP